MLDRLVHQTASLVLRGVLEGAWLALKIGQAGGRGKETEPEGLVDPPQAPISSAELSRALSPTAAADELPRLAGHDDPIIRREVVRNPGLPAEALARLTEDPNQLVAEEARLRIAEAGESYGRDPRPGPCA